MVERFTREDFAHVASLLRTLSDDDLQFRAVSSNNYNVILSALDFAAATRPAEAQAVAEGWKPTELHIVFKDEGGPFNLRFIEVETIDGRSVSAGTWLKRDGYDILALSVHLSDVALAASPATGGA